MADIKKLGTERIYNRAFAAIGMPQVLLWEAIPISNEQCFKLIFESVGNTRPQGVWLMTNKGLRINNQTAPSMELWYHTAPKEVFGQCFTTNGYLSLYNIFHDGHSRVSQTKTSGMLVDQIDRGWRYHCNDYGLNRTFDSLVFTLELL